MKRDDEVDRIVAAWERERPEVDTTPLQILSRVSRLSKHLDQARKRAFHVHDLEGWGFDVLTALRRAGEPYELTPGKLVKQTLVTSGTMTNRIDRLEKRGYVERRPDPGDRRGTLVRLTKKGRHHVDAALDDLLRAERELLDELNDDEVHTLADLLRRVCVQFDQNKGKHK